MAANVDEDSAVNIGTLTSSLTNCVEGIQDTFGNAFGKVAESLKQSVHMMSTMNEMMESFVQQSCIISSNISFSNQKKCAIANILIRNTSKIDIQSFSMNVSLAKLRVAESMEWSENGTTYLNLHLVANREPNQNTSHAEFIQLKTMDLLSLSSKRLILSFNFDFPTQSDVCLSANFPSPGSGRLLHVNHEFGVYLLHQCEIEFFPTRLQLEGCVIASCNVAASSVRHILRVSSLSSLAMESDGHFTIGNQSMYKLVLRHQENLPNDIVKVVCTVSKGHDERLPSIQQLIEEFIILDKVLNKDNL